MLHYQYDLADRLISISNDLGESIKFTVDVAGNRVAEVTRDAGNNIVRIQNRAFDELSRLITSIGAANQTADFGYDNRLKPLELTDSRARITESLVCLKERARLRTVAAFWEIAASRHGHAAPPGDDVIAV